MNEQLSILVALQEVDERIAAVEKELRAVPAAIDALRAGYRREQQVLADLKARLEAAGKERRTAERDLEGHEEKIRKLKDQQFMVKSNKEFQAFNHEIESMAQKKGDFEERILVLMDQSTTLDEEIRQQSAREEIERGRFQKEEARMLAEQRRLEEAVAAEHATRGGIVAGLKPENLTLYNRIRGFYHEGHAVAAVVGGICRSCSIALRPQKLQEVKANDLIQTCDQCKRILYHVEETPSAPPAAEAQG